MMWEMQVFIFALMIIKIYAVPSCTFYDEDRSELVCVSSGEDSELTLTKGLVSDNIATKSLTMKSCKVTDIDCQAFQGLSALNKLDLSENRIHILKACTLDGLTQLVSLNLSNNKISELSKDFFNPVNNMEILDVKGNKINLLQAGIFDNLRKLTNLDVSNNAVKSKELSSHLFSHNYLLKYLDFSRNDMSEAPEDLLTETQSLETLILDRCFLKDIPAFVTRGNSKTLKVLILSTNQISSLNEPTVFVNFDNLEILNLASNAIESVAEDVFAPLRKVKTIVIKHNRLKHLPEKLFQNLPKLVSVDLAYNAIEKIEVSPFKNTPMKNLNISGNKLKYLPENFCHQLRNAGGRLTKFLFTLNPWDCACLRDIMEEVKSLGLVYNSARYDGKEAVCNTDGQVFDCVRN